MAKTWASEIFSGGLYYLRFRPHSGEPAYFFLRVSPEKEPEFQKVLKEAQSFDLADYGDVVTSGFGKEAPAHVKEWVEEWHRGLATAGN